MIVGRQAEAQAVARFLDDARQRPCALVIEGDPGIGKTTLWLDALDKARHLGFRLLVSRAAATESVLAYTGLTDLLGDVDESVWADLPLPQRRGLESALLRVDEQRQGTDARAVASAFVAVIERLAGQGPVVIAIDDLQWLDSSSVHVLSFAARRLANGASLLCTARIGDAPTAIQLQNPDLMRRIRLQPFTVSQLHQVLTLRLGISLTRPTLLRVHEIAGGNPFFALELAREIGENRRSTDLNLPGSLSELVRLRVDRVGAGIEEALLAIASLPIATVPMVARITDIAPGRLVELLADAEAEEVVAIDGNHVRFTHPLLAYGVYSGAAPGRRRSMHRRLAKLVVEPELCARHLALSDATGEPQTIRALDAAAEIARARGAPAAAAELLELAVGLGADDPSRRIRCATDYFDAGDAAHARQILEAVLAGGSADNARAEALYQLATVRIYDDSLPEAVELLEKGLIDAGADAALRVRILTALSFALVDAGQPDRAYDRVQQAVADAERSGVGSLISLALGMRAILDFIGGRGFDEHAMQRAVALEQPDLRVSIANRPHVQEALLRAWTGDLVAGRDGITAVSRRCRAAGEEAELMFVSFHAALIDIWVGDLGSAATTADAAAERAAQLGNDFSLFIALTLQGAVAAYAGRIDEARRDLAQGIAAGQRCGSASLVGWALTLAGFVEVSCGDHQAVLDALEPLLPTVQSMPDATEIIVASFYPDAVEAMIGLGRVEEAEPLVEALERNGRRLDRAWMLAVGLRCRAMLLAARGELAAATEKAELAMLEHKRLPMPFERARTQLLLGGLQRRQRRWDVAPATLEQALNTFRDIGTMVWAARAEAELTRISTARPHATGLSPSERQVAEMVLSGMSNRDIAAAMFVSPKTVEKHLSRIYRKLGVHSRVELYRKLDE